MITVSSSTTAARLQSIIDSAPAGETVQLGAGTFRFDRTIVIDRDDITVLGKGAGATNIALEGSARANGAFRIGSEIDNSTYTGDFRLAQPAGEGQRSLHLADASGLRPGDHLWIELDNSSAYLNSLGDHEWREDKPLRTSMVEVAAVHGDSVQLVNRLAFDFDRAASVQRIAITEDVRLGGFTVHSGLRDADPGDFANLSRAYDRSNVVSVSATSHVRLFDIAVDNAPSNGFTIAQSVFLEGSNLSVDGAINKGDGGNGYAFQLRALYDGHLAGLEAHDTRHALLFASWTSEANNRVQVRDTNRDVNFHGGPDHDNVVEVLRSERTEKESHYLSPTLFVNEDGTSYGAPTDPHANSVTFRTVTGTNKAETLVADAAGASFDARKGNDTLVGGAGKDRLLGGDGDDHIVGSRGNDTIQGGAGRDVLSYAGDLADYRVSRDGANFVILKHEGGRDVVSGIEAFHFADGSVAASKLPLKHGPVPDHHTGGGDDGPGAGTGHGHVYSAQSHRLGPNGDALTLIGNKDVDGIGNALGNALAGNSGDNQLSGLGADDRIMARGGNDFLSGGTGNDQLHGQAGNDRLFGGTGMDVLNGGSGADTFVFTTGRDAAEDFSLAQGDRVDTAPTRFANADAFLAAFSRAAASHGDTYDKLGIDVAGHGHHTELHVRGDDGEMLMLSLHGASVASLLVHSDWII